MYLHENLCLHQHRSGHQDQVLPRQLFKGSVNQLANIKGSVNATMNRLRNQLMLLLTTKIEGSVNVNLITKEQQQKKD